MNKDKKDFLIIVSAITICMVSALCALFSPYDNAYMFWLIPLLYYTFCGYVRFLNCYGEGEFTIKKVGIMIGYIFLWGTYLIVTSWILDIEKIQNRGVKRNDRHSGD